MFIYIFYSVNNVKRVLTVTLNPAIDITHTVPALIIGECNRVTTTQREPGGKGINVATALKDGGLEVDVTGILGNKNSKIFTEHFKKIHINDHFLYIDGSNRECIKIKNSSNGIITELNSSGLHLNLQNISDFIKQYTKIVQNYDYIILSGSLPLGLENTFYQKLIKINNQYKKFTALDTNGHTLSYSLGEERVNLIKPNITELGELYPETITKPLNYRVIDRCVSRLYRYADSILLTLGEKGSRFYTQDAIYSVDTPKIDTVSSVGAGDSFLAGYILGLYENKTIEESLKTASSWAASNLHTIEPGLSDMEPPQNFYNIINVKKSI